jgi:mono/diheme cytochrome c family protein
MLHGPLRSLALATILLAAPAWPAAATAPAGAPRPGGSPYVSAKNCGACHDVMYKAWADSPHARSASSPAFLETLRRVVEAAPDKRAARLGCVWCHAPTTILSGDLDLQQAISQEGITCDFCHTVADVDMEQEGTPFVLKPGPVKRGPFEYASKIQGHETAYSALHRASPLLCASCHEFRNARGVPVLSNYSEWKDGPYPARGVACQDCHMALVPGSPARGAAPKSGLRVVNLHRLVGGSSISQLARGLDLRIESVAIAGGTAEVAIVVTNVAAGHSIPGGLSTKSLVLAVAAEGADGRLENRQERVYRRELRDDRGIVVETVADMFLKAASVGSDTRIKPKESRRERFTVPVPPGARAIVARLEYRDASDPRSAPQTSTVTEVKRPLGTR